MADPLDMRRQGSHARRPTVTVHLPTAGEDAQSKPDNEEKKVNSSFSNSSPSPTQRPRLGLPPLTPTEADRDRERPRLGLALTPTEVDRDRTCSSPLYRSRQRPDSPFRMPSIVSSNSSSNQPNQLYFNNDSPKSNVSTDEVEVRWHMSDELDTTQPHPDQKSFNLQQQQQQQQLQLQQQIQQLPIPPALQPFAVPWLAETSFTEQSLDFHYERQEPQQETQALQLSPLLLSQPLASPAARAAPFPLPTGPVLSGTLGLPFVASPRRTGQEAPLQPALGLRESPLNSDRSLLPKVRGSPKLTPRHHHSGSDELHRSSSMLQRSFRHYRSDSNPKQINHLLSASLPNIPLSGDLSTQPLNGDRPHVDMDTRWGSGKEGKWESSGVRQGSNETGGYVGGEDIGAWGSPSQQTRSSKKNSHRFRVPTDGRDQCELCGLEESAHTPEDRTKRHLSFMSRLTRSSSAFPTRRQVVTKQGFLLAKRAGKGKKWKRRYFVLGGDTLTWYNDTKNVEDVSILDHAGSIRLQGANLVSYTTDVMEHERDQLLGGEHLFGIANQYGEHLLFLGASRDAERARWIRALVECGAAYLGLTGHTPKRADSLKEGFLLRQNHNPFFNSWVRLYFVLLPTSLLSFRSRNDKNPVKITPLNAECHLEIDYREGSYTWKLIDEFKQSIILKATDEQHRRGWLTELQKAIGKQASIAVPSSHNRQTSATGIKQQTDTSQLGGAMSAGPAGGKKEKETAVAEISTGAAIPILALEGFDSTGHQDVLQDKEGVDASSESSDEEEERRRFEMNKGKQQRQSLNKRFKSSVSLPTLPSLPTFPTLPSLPNLGMFSVRREASGIVDDATTGWPDQEDYDSPILTSLRISEEDMTILHEMLEAFLQDSRCLVHQCPGLVLNLRNLPFCEEHIEEHAPIWLEQQEQERLRQKAEFSWPQQQPSPRSGLRRKDSGAWSMDGTESPSMLSGASHDADVAGTESVQRQKSPPLAQSDSLGSNSGRGIPPLPSSDSNSSDSDPRTPPEDIASDVKHFSRRSRKSKSDELQKNLKRLDHLLTVINGDGRSVDECNLIANELAAGLGMSPLSGNVSDGVSSGSISALSTPPSATHALSEVTNSSIYVCNNCAAERAKEKYPCFSCRGLCCIRCVQWVNFPLSLAPWKCPICQHGFITADICPQCGGSRPGKMQARSARRSTSVDNLRAVCRICAQGLEQKKLLARSSSPTSLPGHPSPSYDGDVSSPGISPSSSRRTLPNVVSFAAQLVSPGSRRSRRPSPAQSTRSTRQTGGAAGGAEGGEWDSTSQLPAQSPFLGGWKGTADSHSPLSNMPLFETKHVDLRGEDERVNTVMQTPQPRSATSPSHRGNNSSTSSPRRGLLSLSTTVQARSGLDADSGPRVESSRGRTILSTLLRRNKSPAVVPRQTKE